MCVVLEVVGRERDVGLMSCGLSGGYPEGAVGGGGDGGFEGS